MVKMRLSRTKKFSLSQNFFECAFQT